MPRTPARNPDAPRRTDRLELRTTPEEKRLLAAAAAYERTDVTGLVLRSALSVASAVIERAERVALSERDSARVLELLENPPPPTARLRSSASSLLRNDGA